MPKPDRKREKTFTEDPIGVMIDVMARQENPGMSDRYFDQTVNGPQGLPVSPRINAAGWDAFLAQAPESANIEDRRDDTIDDFIRRQLEDQLNPFEYAFRKVQRR